MDLWSKSESSHFENSPSFQICQIMSCLLKHFIRKIKIKVNRCFDVPNIILKIEVVYANVKVVMRELKILNI